MYRLTEVDLAFADDFILFRDAYPGLNLASKLVRASKEAFGAI